MLLLPEVFDAATAERFGLVNFVVPKEDFDVEVVKLTKRLLEGPSHAYAAVKKPTYQSLATSFADQLDGERRAMVEMSTGKDFQEGVKAFVEKRAPVSQGPTDRSAATIARARRRRDTLAAADVMLPWSEGTSP